MPVATAVALLDNVSKGNSKTRMVAQDSQDFILYHGLSKTETTRLLALPVIKIKLKYLTNVLTNLSLLSERKKKVI
jgi:hypothetical protein